MVGIVGFLQGAKSIRRRRGRGRTMEFGGAWTGRTIWPFGRVVRSMSSPGRRQRGTLRELTNPARRSPVARHAFEPRDLRSEPVEALQLDGEDFLTCFRQRSSPRSGMIADHLFSILQNEADSELLVQVASKVGCRGCPRRSDGRHPRGQLTALAKPDGVVREIVVGDIKISGQNHRDPPFCTLLLLVSSTCPPRRSRKVREGNRATPSCQRSSHWVSTRLWEAIQR